MGIAFLGVGFRVWGLGIADVVATTKGLDTRLSVEIEHPFDCKVTSPIRTRPPLGPYSRTKLRALWWP